MHLSQAEVRWALIAIGAVAVFVFAIVVSGRRSRAFSTLAATLGYTYVQLATKFIAAGPGQLPVFNEGFAREPGDLMRTTGGKAALFDYQCTTGSSRFPQDHAATMYAVSAPADRPYPQFVVRPIGGLDRLAIKLGKMQDITFDSKPAFSQHYVVQGLDELQVRQRLNDGALDFFAQQRDWHAEAWSG